MQKCVEISGPDAEAFTNLLTSRDISKAALERAQQQGLKRKVVGVFMGGDVLAKNNEHRWPVTTANGKKVGWVSSAVYSPRVERNIGFALLDIDYTDGSTPLQVESADGIRDIEITTLPFIDPDKTIPRASLRKT